MFKNVLDTHEVGECGGKVVLQLNTSLIWNDGIYRIIVPQYFYTDLASVPRLPLIYTLWGDKAHREAVLHDYLYRKDCVVYDLSAMTTVVGVSRKFADDMFLKAMESRNQPFYIRYPMYAGVRGGGMFAYHKMDVADCFDMSECYTI